MSQRFSFAGFLICCAAGGAIYLGLIYPIFRLFDPSPGVGTADRTSGQTANSSNRYGFGPDWQCFGKPSGPVCFKPGAFPQKKGN
jgi:hypothetical protein